MRGILISETERRVATELKQGSIGENCVRNEIDEERSNPSVQSEGGANDTKFSVHQANSVTLYDTNPSLGGDGSKATHAPTEALLYQNELVEPN